MLISNEYRDLNRRLHDEVAGYGCGGWRWVGIALKIAKKHNCHSILDYGSGKGTFERWFPDWLGIDVTSYDPITAPTIPKPRDLVLSVDVLEHIEPDNLADVLKDMRAKTRKIGVFLISTRPAAKFLHDGRNAHLIVENKSWWYRQLAIHWSRVKDMTLEYPELANGSEALFLVEA